jgi:DNA-binding NarL/FixJ family response regulator
MNKQDTVTRVLVLSNHEVLKYAVESDLAREFTLVSHEESQEAIHDLDMLSPDVIVMDVDHLIMEDGASTAKWLHDNHPDMGAIFMMNVGADNDLDTLASAGGFTLDSMRGALESMHSSIREMADSGPEYLMFGYRLKIRTESEELALSA